jgi:hypothetical protein
MWRRFLVWAFFRIERALSVRVIEKRLKELGLSRSDAQFVISSYRKAVKNIT